MEGLFTFVAAAIGLALSATAVYALYSSSRHGQLREFARGATSIFDEREPLGLMTDHFPPPKAARRHQSAAPGAPTGAVGD
jgi:hypothetical protein